MGDKQPLDDSKEGSYDHQVEVQMYSGKMEAAEPVTHWTGARESSQAGPGIIRNCI